MIKKFIAIRNVGRFKNSAARPMPELRDYTLVFGPNGHGKTTIGAVLRSLQTGDVDHILGRRTLSASDSPRVELLLDSGSVTFDGQSWSQPGPPISIFDGEFVAENIHSGEVVGVGHKRNLYRIIIGESGVALAQRDTQLAEASRALTSQISSARRAIESHVPEGMSFNDFLALPDDPEISARINESQRQIQAAEKAQSIRDRQAFEPLAELVLPENFSELLARTIGDVSDAAELALVSHLESHPVEGDGRAWIRAGLPSVEAGSCPFCGQSVEGLPLIEVFKSAFNAAYEQFANDLAALRRDTQADLGEAAANRLDRRQDRHNDALGFWSEYCALEALDLRFPEGYREVMTGLLTAATSLLDRKTLTPMERLQPDEALVEALAQSTRFNGRVVAFNEAVESANLLVSARREATALIETDTAAAQLRTLLATRVRHSQHVLPLCTEYERLVQEKVTVDAEKEEARQALNEHTNGVVSPYESRINELLMAFNAGFHIAETRHSYPSGLASSSYQLVIDGTPVALGDGDTPRSEPSFKNTLSSGDRTTLALAFFLAHLERDPGLASRIVVFDDPFNSQDAFRRRQTVLEIMKIGRRCNQVIVLSHDQAFLKLVWEKVEPGKRVALSVADHRAQGSKIIEFDLEEACQGRTLADLDDLQGFLTNGTGDPRDLVRKLRPVLETHCRTTYIGSFRADDWLGDIVRKIREGGDQHPAFALYDELDAINDYTKEYHHGADLHVTSEPPIDPDELAGFVRRTVVIVNASTA